MDTGSKKIQQKMVGSIGDVLAIGELGLFRCDLHFSVCRSTYCLPYNRFFFSCRASARSELYDDRLKNLKIFSAEHSHEDPK